MLDAVGLHRVAHRLWRWRVPLLPRLFDGLVFLLFNTVLHHTTEVGKGTKCAYRGMSVLVHRRCRIGRNVYLGAHVVLGGRSGHEDVPVVEDDVFIGPNSTVLGPIVIGRGTTIGAGSVVLESTAPGSTVAGVPAKPIRSAGGRARGDEGPR
jgi:serine O-acetyltransferase